VLFESHLSETASFALANHSPLTAYSTVRYCANTMTWTMSPLAGPQDWDCNGTISAFVESADINGDGKITRLAPYDDWAHLVYDGGQIGKTAAAVLPAVSHQQEPTMQDLLETAPLIIQTDMSPPTTTATISPSANASGWNNSNVTVTLSSTDNEPGGSGVKQITYSATGAQTIASTVVNAASASIVITTEGTTTITFFGTDNAGNVETANTLTVKLDKTPPSISGTRTPAPNANGWNNTNVAVSLVCSDSLSGLARGSPPAPMTFTSEGAGQSVTGTCTDVAGNSASAAVNGINIDKTPPMLACTASPNVLWPPNNKLVPVNVSVTVSDVLSGPSGFTLVSVSSNEPDSGQGDIQGFVTGTASTAGQLRPTIGFRNRSRVHVHV